MQQTGNDEVGVIVWLDAFGQRSATQVVASDQGDQKGMLDVVVECIALAQALQSNTSNAVEPLGMLVMRRAKELSDILGRSLPSESAAISGIVIIAVEP
jgi:hypothetical protein